VLAEGSGEREHRGDPGAAGSGEPGVEVGVGSPTRWEPVEVAEFFFEAPGQNSTCRARRSWTIWSRWVLVHVPGSFSSAHRVCLSSWAAGSCRTLVIGVGRATPALLRAVFHAARRTSSTAKLAT